MNKRELERLWRQNTVERRRSRPDLKEQQDLSGHGNRFTYTYWFCRCPECRAANMRYCKRNKVAKARSNKAQKSEK